LAILKSYSNKKASQRPKLNNTVNSSFSTKCEEPEVLIDTTDGTTLRMCTNKKVMEYESLALLGKLAINDVRNKYWRDYY